MSSPGIAAAAGRLRLEITLPPEIRFQGPSGLTDTTLIRGNVVIGRDARADVVLIGDDTVEYVSGFHAVIAYSEVGGVWILRDHHSSQGTTVTAADGTEGARAGELLPDVAVPLLDGDRVTLAGVVEFTVTVIPPERGKRTRGARDPASAAVPPLRVLDDNHVHLARVLVDLVREGAHKDKGFSQEVLNRSFMDKSAVYRAGRDLMRYPAIRRRLELPDADLSKTRLRPLAVAVSQAQPAWLHDAPSAR